ncbi:MAG: hypothetical protein ACXVHV_09405 [Methanobacterium sp.]
MFQLLAIHPLLERLASMPAYSIALYAQCLSEKHENILLVPIVQPIPVLL